MIHFTYLAAMLAYSRNKFALIPVPQIRCVHTWCQWVIHSLMKPKLFSSEKFIPLGLFYYMHKMAASVTQRMYIRT
jgi:hypothetical protein